ncbi:MAG TPA: hypothetical protein VLJ84_08715 [Usitatibacter sp.]|nr:hypothetical protein [Usitatibacter sp.]
MAHRRLGGLRAIAAIAFLALAADSFALSLGEPVVGSAQGEPLDVRFPVSLERGESIQPSCFRRAASPGGAAGLAAGTVSLERSAGGTMLRVRSSSPVAGDTVSVAVVAQCAGQPQEYRREYTLAVGARASAPSQAATAKPSPSAAPATSSALLPSIATLIARIGDTLESIARAIFPSNRAARVSYIEALRANNPPLAALRADEPIPVDTPVSLPDLRAFSQAQRAHPHAAHEAAAAVPREKPVARTRAAREVPEESPAKAAPVEKAPRSQKAARPRAESAAPPLRESIMPPREAPSAATTRGDFVLKLSSPVIDLSRSRGIDERSRAQLRERLTILDADDQVSALLALQHSVKQLETQVAQLQLKLSGMPSSFPATPAASSKPPQPPVVTAPPPAPVEAKPAPTPVETKPAPAPVEAKVAPAPPPVETKVAPAPPPEETKPVPPPVEAKPAPAPVEAKESPRPRPVLPVEQPTPWMDYALWGLAVLLLVVAVLLAVRLARRARSAREAAQAEEAVPLPEVPPPADDSIVVAEEPVRGPELPPIIAAPSRREIDSDVVLPTRLPSNTEDLRQRYIEERFPEIGKGVILLDDPDSVVKGARLFYEDGALARAVELLQYAIERRPEEIKTWLALFEIFRLERLTGEFAQLATRFREQHGKSEYWPKVQYFGREIDPGNALYAAPAINNFETIGPAQARRIAAADAVDPVAENWLGAPMDFQNEVLANELRKTLMSDSGINEEDLVPNPMPALRNVEMFSVA